jgi:hypothetical protein
MIPREFMAFFFLLVKKPHAENHETEYGFAFPVVRLCSLAARSKNMQDIQLHAAWDGHGGVFVSRTTASDSLAFNYANGCTFSNTSVHGSVGILYFSWSMQLW